MKCIVRHISVLFLTVMLAVGLCGCGEEIVLEHQYDTFETTDKYQSGTAEHGQGLSFYATSLCVGGNENVLDDTVTGGLSEAAGLFDLQQLTIPYAQNIHEKLYPASTTKILTAYVALKYGDLEQIAVVSEAAIQLEAGSSVCGLSAGDKISLEQLLYGLMLCSGNDAANVIAETVAGSVEEFAVLMNQEAQALGATNSQFLNPHGLHHEQHYTTAYDLQLIFCKALEDARFRQLINAEKYQAEFQNSQGETIVKDWSNTNRYLTGEEEVPEGIVVIGGKTGTTNDAGHCLVLYSENVSGVPYVSIVLKADSKDDLYYQMTELLKKAALN